MVDSPPPKKTKSMEYYVERISESMIERSRNEINARRRDREEMAELLELVRDDGVPGGSELYFIATELLRSAARRTAFRSFEDPKDRIAWLQWTWDNVMKK